ncbi:hypothetical protein COH45_12215, partial [Neisseria meningitidis]
MANSDKGNISYYLVLDIFQATSHIIYVYKLHTGGRGDTADAAQAEERGERRGGRRRKEKKRKEQE